MTYRNDPRAFPGVEILVPSPLCSVLPDRIDIMELHELGRTDYFFGPILIFLKTHKISLECFLIFSEKQEIVRLINSLMWTWWLD